MNPRTSARFGWNESTFLLLGALVALLLMAFALLFSARAQAQTAGYGTDRSANPPSLTGLNLLATIAVNPGRVKFELEVACTAGIQLVIDDGTDTSTNCTAGKCTVLPLSGPAVAGSQGSYYLNSTHTGRYRLYSTSATCQVGAHEW